MKQVMPHKQKLINLLGDFQNALILDYGCDNGDFVELLLNSVDKPKAIIAVDSDENMISHIQKKFFSHY